MIPYPIEEMRKFILKEYPNLNNMHHPDYKAGALMSAILRWWTDEQQPEIENLRKQVKDLKEIAIGESERRHISDMPRFGFVLDSEFCPDPRKLAIDQLSEEHPEAFK